MSGVDYISPMETNRRVEDHSPRHLASIYRVCIAGTLPSSWENRLGGLQVVHEERNESSGPTTLMGAVNDQAELLGILNTLHELRCPLLLVEEVDVKSLPSRQP